MVEKTNSTNARNTMKESYKIQEEAYPKKICGYCNEASTYNEDMQCWCNKHDMEVDEMTGICDNYNKFI